ncbi:MAG: glycosyltransferase [Opitutaceae bacterium]|nr:glycosyltransferase [Opitutaceae bacterium]
MQQVRKAQSEFLYTGFAWPHHDAASGYHHVVPPGFRFINGARLFFGRSNPGTWQRKLNFVLTDLYTLAIGIQYNYIIYIYPEQTAIISPWVLRHLGKKLTFVCHLKADYWTNQKDYSWRNPVVKTLAFLRGNTITQPHNIIVLNENEISSFEKISHAQVVAIPHGAFAAMPRNLEPQMWPLKEVLIIGENYRDFALMTEIINALSVKMPGIRVGIVGIRKQWLRGLATGNYEILPRLGEREYRQRIFEALCVILPLKYATANNTIFEALGEGTPVYCNASCVGVRYYLPDEEYLFEDTEDLIFKLRELISLSPEQRRTLSDQLRSHLNEHFGWEKVRTQVASLSLIGSTDSFSEA